MSWNYSYHGIQNAWTKATGSGIKVMVIDSGVSPDQDNLGSQFNQGLSSGRTIEKMFTLPGATSADDDCGHGTAMSGAVAAPRCADGNSCGVAYNCNFVICRAANDVYLDGSDEIKGVSDAYTWAADNSTVKIISMSMGRLTASGQIKDAIQYASGKGKLMFCAGGTSFSWSSWLVGVIFPATLDQVQAVTGIKDKSTLTICDDCHKGKQIDFVIVMEKQAGGLHSLSTATSGDVPTTVGGSSVSTATAAGIAALVWSRFPTYTREEVVNKLTITASEYPKKNKSYGWGKLNADAATN
ncbi:MAG TPA: S8/S53 family peptidase [Panacibacter sp.]|nr:S8/S53 family peptidase [Panacibacter sp.]